MRDNTDHLVDALADNAAPLLAACLEPPLPVIDRERVHFGGDYGN